jgi:Flp pilus assembly protein CpaB
LPVNLATTAAGLATLPGSRVDVMLTIKGRDAQSTISKIIVQNALVLAADGRVDREGELIAPASVVTLALNNKDRLIATTAKDMGTLTLSLRKLDENQVTKDTNISGDVVLNGDKKDPPPPQSKVIEPPPAPSAPPAPPKPELPAGTPGKLDIANGGERRTIRFRVLENGEVEYEDDLPGRPAVQPQSPPQPARPLSSVPGKSGPRDF